MGFAANGLPRAVLDLPGSVGVPYDCTLHDYFTICPQYHLVTEDGRYCGEPDLASCETCIDTYGSSLTEPLSTAELRRRSARWKG